MTRECQILYAVRAAGTEWSARQVGVLVGDHPLRMVQRDQPARDAIRVDCCDPGHRYDPTPRPEVMW